MGNQCCCCCNYNHRNINSNHHRCSNNEIITDNNNNNNNNCFINLLNYYPQLLFTNCFRINCNSSFRRNKSTNNTDNKTFDSIENIDELNQNSRNQEQFELQPNQTIDSINNNVIIFSDDDNNNNNNNNNNFKRNNQQSCSFNSSVPSSSSYSLSLSSEQIHNNKGNECKNRSIEQLPGQQQQQQQMPNDRYCHYQQQLKQQLKQRQQSISDHNTKNVKHLQKLNFNNTVIDSNAIDDTKSSSSSSLLLLSKTDNKTKNQHNRQHYRLFEHQASIQSTPPTIIHSSHHHSNSHCFDCPYNFNPLLLSPTSASNVVRSKLKFDLQRQLNEMIQRQRSASHCPHAVNIDRNTKSGSSSSKNKCCCCQKARNISINSSQSSKNSGNIVVDPFMQKMVQQHGLSPSSSSSNFHGRQKRASSLRALNKRLNFFDTTNTNFKFDGSSSRNGSRQGSRKQKRQPIKLMDLGDDCLLAIFEYLTLQEKIYYERVCQRWQRLIRLSLQASVSLKIGEHSVKCNCQCAHYPSWDFPPSKRFPRDNVGFIIYPKSTIQYLLTLCNQLKCINFSHCYLDDETLQIIMNHSDKVECLHLNDIRLEEDSDELPNGLLEKSNKQQINEAINNGQQQGDQDSTISSAVGAFASEQLAVFGGLMRKLSTRRSLKKKGNQNQETCSDTAGKRNSNISILSKKSITSSVLNLVNHTGASSPESVNHSSNHVISKCIKNPVNNTRSSPISSSNNTINSGRQINVSKQQQRTNEMSPLIQQSTTTTTTTRMTPNLNLSTTTNATTATVQMDPFEAAIHEKTTAVYFPHDDMRTSLENIIRKTQLNNQKQQQQPPKTPSPHNGPQSPTIIFHLAQQQSSSSLSSQPQQQQQHQQQHNSMQKFPPKPSITPSATQRRREWSKHRLTQQTDSNRINNVMMKQLDDQLMMPINVINDTINSNDSFLTLNDESTSVTTTNGYTKSSGNANRLQNHLSPNLAPNIASIQCDSNNGHRGFNPTITTTATTITSQSGASSSGGSGASIMTGNQLADLNSSEINSNSLTTTQCQSSSLINTNRKTMIDSMIKQMDNNKMDHVQAYVEQEQIRHEIRQSHLSQWKAFAKKLGSQIRSLSLGNLSSVDSIVIDILLKYSTILEELRINNEIDILSYLSVIKHSIKRIYINCEHGIGLECVSLLAYRNYAEKVISLGRVDVPPDLIDSVISTIGSNFCNLQSLYLRIHNFDIDVATPANLLFDNLRELNLQFVSGNVDQPFRQFIQLGWSSVRILTIQYASITEESVRAIHEHMPQLRKLVLYAIEFRCDHLSKRYGHRICMNCSHAVWKSIAALPHLQHLKLYRVIIDDEICKALSRMYRLHHLELQYCSNVNDNVVNVCSELARRCQRRRFTLAIISRGFLTLKPPADCNNLFIDIKVACN